MSEDTKIIIWIVTIGVAIIAIAAVGKNSQKHRETARKASRQTDDPHLRELREMNDRLEANDKKLSSIKWSVGVISCIVVVYFVLSR